MDHWQSFFSRLKNSSISRIFIRPYYHRLMNHDPDQVQDFERNEHEQAIAARSQREESKHMSNDERIQHSESIHLVC